MALYRELCFMQGDEAREWLDKLDNAPASDVALAMIDEGYADGEGVLADTWPAGAADVCTVIYPQGGLPVVFTYNLHDGGYVSLFEVVEGGDDLG